MLVIALFLIWLVASSSAQSLPRDTAVDEYSETGTVTLMYQVSIRDTIQFQNWQQTWTP